MATTSPNAMLIDPETIVAGLESAENQRDILALTGQAFADIAQQTGAISNTFNDIVSAGAAGQPGALNITATIGTGSTIDVNVLGTIDVSVPGTIDVSVPGTIGANVSGAIGSTVTIDCLGRPAEELLKGYLSKAAHAVFHLWTMAHTRIGEFQTALDCSIGNVAKEICELRPLAGGIGNHLHDLTVEIKEMKDILQKELRCICDSAGGIKSCIERNQLEHIAEHATPALRAEALRRELDSLRIAMENNAEANSIRFDRIEEEAAAARQTGSRAGGPNKR